MVENALSGPCVYFDKTPNVQVKWISVNIKTTPVSVVLKSFKIIGEHTSDNRLTSVQKPVWVKIGHLGREALNDIPCHHYNHCPNTVGTHHFSTTKMESIKLTGESLAMAELAKMNTVDNKHMNVG